MSTSPEPVLRLSSECLLSKWGFNDGSEPDALLDWLDDRNLPYPKDWDTVLRTLVRERLAPALNRDVELVDVETCHNPIRAAKVDGVDVVGYWTREPEEFPVRLVDVTVDVPMAEVADLIRRCDAGELDGLER